MMPSSPIVHCAACDECTCTERQIDVLYVSPERFRGKPQMGIPTVMPWASLAAYLSRPSIGDAKDVAGGYSPARYVGNVRRKSSLDRIWALVVDIDENGHVDSIADAVSRYRSIVHSTFSSTDDAPRCRLLLELAEPIDAATYELVHKVVRAHLRTAGIVADEGAKDGSRLSYAPVIRDGARYYFRQTHGKALDPNKVLAANPPPPRPALAPLPAPDHADRYVGAALRKAAEALLRATPGERHYTLSKEAFTLARFGLSEGEIERALMPAAIASMGEGRRHEAERTIRDAIRARKGAA